MNTFTTDLDPISKFHKYQIIGLDLIEQCAVFIDKLKYGKCY